ncbi:transcriptional regulator [Superficieibacter electus]|uniref:Inhibitor of hydrogen peroxide resistance n=1 Tax=Superficieibacter electus TaxID=2022662 RepID=A0A2P5GSW2_9ENTR|nr:helix-turn-helix domain-containing protein [Superficieibacter electus]POP46912.1 transcriptional regulator [Superficieibacter electus]POP49650.1 transcriptional regulator [Superficieibacter electus]
MTTPCKPLNEFSVLDKHLSLHGTRFTCHEGEPFPFSDEQTHNYTIVFQRGIISLSRKYNDILLGFASAPFIVGLSADAIENASDYVLQAESECSGYYLPASETLSILEKEGIWREAFYWLTWQHRMLEKRDMHLVGTSNYNQIRSTLLTMAQWDETLRSRIGVINYIQRRTRVSRSVIAEVLSALRRGSYIQMHKGKLVNVNRLPYDY